MFPYIRNIKVNNCYTYKDFTISDEISEHFSHIILTGKNGSGKTTILNRVSALIEQASADDLAPPQKIEQLKTLLKENPKHASAKQWGEKLDILTDIELDFSPKKKSAALELPDYSYFKINRGTYIFSFFKAHREVSLDTVKTVSVNTDFENQLSKNANQQNFIKQFKQYLVNKKVYEAFDYMDSKTDSLSQNKIFFDNFTKTLRTIFKDRGLVLEFKKDNFEFYLNFTNGQKVTFNQLSEGFSAFLSIIMDLILRDDLIRKNKNDFKFDPQGIVIIDEPETHFHLEMQYEILPLLVSLFPKIQFLIATHSPAIISSLENALVYDISSKKTVSGWIQGSSFSELMVTHFGLENEFAPKADELLLRINSKYDEKDIIGLNNLLEEYEKILTPSLRLEIESRIIEIKSKLNKK